jgi:hypothetical protein
VRAGAAQTSGEPYQLGRVRRVGNVGVDVVIVVLVAVVIDGNGDVDVDDLP